MLGILKRDLSLMILDKKNRLFLLLGIPFIFFAVEIDNPKLIYLVILYTYTYIISITPFQYDITNKTVYMVNSLPISRKEVVIYKYLLTFVYFLMTIVYAGVYLWIINALGIKTVDYFDLEMIKFSLIIILISVALIYPAYFRFEPKMARIVHMINFSVFFVGYINIGFLGKKALVGNLGLLSNDKYILFIAIALYLLSLLISIRFYENRDL